MFHNMINNIGEDNHQEALDQAEGVREPCQTDGASKRLGNYYQQFVILLNAFKMMPLTLAVVMF